MWATQNKAENSNIVPYASNPDFFFFDFLFLREKRVMQSNKQESPYKNQSQIMLGIVLEWTKEYFLG